MAKVIEADLDQAPELDEAWFAKARPAREVHGDAFVDAQKRPRGRPKLDAPKDTVKLRVDHDVVEHFKAAGAGWQTRMNEALRAAVFPTQEAAAAEAKRMARSRPAKDVGELISATAKAAKPSGGLTFGPKRAGFGDRLKKKP